MERPDPHRVTGVAQEVPQAVPHLAGRPVGERHGEDAPRIGPAFDDPRDALDEHAGFPGAGAGEDEEGAFAVVYGGLLLSVERGGHPGWCSALIQTASIIG